MQLRVPRVVGMLGTGLLLANVPGHVVAAFPAKWGVQMRAAALATIFLRCGLELEFKVCGHGGLASVHGASGGESAVQRVQNAGIYTLSLQSDESSPLLRLG